MVNSTVIAVILVSLILFLYTTPIQSQQQQACGLLNSCDYLISYSIFQVGSCGRAARCLWELQHLNNKLNRQSPNAPALVNYEAEIKDLLCKIPTLTAYHSKLVDDNAKPFDVCGEGETDKDEISKKFPFYPMPTFYIYYDGSTTTGHKPADRMYLQQMEECWKKELDCVTKLSRKVSTECGKLDEAKMKKMEAVFNMKIRNKKFYKMALLDIDLLNRSFSEAPDTFGKPVAGFETPGSSGNVPPNYRKTTNCSLLQFYRRQVGERGSQDNSSTGSPMFADDYHFSSIDYQVRGPYFDLYILYEADDDFKAQPGNWWNETKAYQELAHYLPLDMVPAINDAIYCVYDKVNAIEMSWEPTKFCWSTSTFICVEKHKLEGNKNDCGGTAFNPSRHVVNGIPVPIYNGEDYKDP